jgi:predicted dehydrogenase
MSKPLRWGILGVAKINDRLLPAFAQARGIELVGLASRSFDKARAAAAEAQLPNAYGSYEALLADQTIDVVYIPLPNHLHGEWVRRAADAGKHILCEKPLTPTAIEAESVISYCRARGVRLMDGFMWPHHPRTHRLKAFLNFGGIGTIHRVTSAFTFQLPVDPQNIRYQADAGGGSLLDVGCYPVYGIRWAMGAEPVKVYATATFVHGVDLCLSGTLWFANGAVATFDSGFQAPLRGWLEITGSTGVVRVPEMWLPGPDAEYEIHRDDRPMEVVCNPGANQIVCMLEAFAAAIREEHDPNPSPDEALKTLRVLDALWESATTGREVGV